MDESRLRDLASRYLLPFFSGARLEDDALPSTLGHKLVAYTTPCSIAFKIEKSDKYRLVVSRSQPFQLSRGDKIPEIEIFNAFVSVVAEQKEVLSSKFAEDLLPNFQRRVVARAIGSDTVGKFRQTSEEMILKVIDQLSSWGERLYEGAPISASIGLRHMDVKDHDVDLADIAAQDFGAVLSNGHDTIITFNYHSHFAGHENLDLAKSIPSFCPYRQARIAEWTTQHERRVAATLNRLGEILIYRDHKLVFARRSGRWHFLTHVPVVKQMNSPKLEELRIKIYETCLDSSFSRTGACIGAINTDANPEWKSVVSKKDILSLPKSTKAKSLSRLIAGKKFQQLDRRVRQELVAIDGATVLSHQGEILAVGAILKIDGGSAGGGRLAAATTLSKFGLGVKISQDGGITGFRDEKVAFKVM